MLESKRGTWVESFDYCVAVARPDGTLTDEYYCEGGPWALYSASVYWAVMTITSIGYGDIHATDRNVSEQVVNTLLMLTGGMLWGHVIGTFCGVVATMSPQTTEFNRRMDDLNRYCGLHHLPPDVRRRLREYLHQTKHLQISHASKELIELLSPALQGEVTWLVHKPWLSRVTFFQGAEPEFLVQIALSLSPLVFTPGELAINGFLYIVHRGIALYGGRVLTSGKVWGEDCIIASVHLQRRWCARAMNYLEVYMVSRDAVLAVAEAFPKTHERIRKTAIRMAVRRQFILAAKLMSGGTGYFASKTQVFDRLLEQATTVPLTEMKLQATLTAHRFEVNNTALVKRGTGLSMDGVPIVDDGEEERKRASQEEAPSSPSRDSSFRRGAAPSSAASLNGHTMPVSSDLQAVTSALGANSTSRVPVATGTVVGAEVLAAVEQTKQELGARIDTLSDGLSSLQSSFEELLKRLPPAPEG